MFKSPVTNYRLKRNLEDYHKPQKGTKSTKGFLNHFVIFVPFCG